MAASRIPQMPAPNAHLLDIIADMTGLGTWELAVDSMTPLWSHHARHIFGIDPAAAITFADILECYAVEARPVLENAFREAVASGRSFDHTLPAIRTDGARLWVRCVGDAEVADERTVRLSGGGSGRHTTARSGPAPAARLALQLPGSLGI